MASLIEMIKNPALPSAKALPKVQDTAVKNTSPIKNPSTTDTTTPVVANTAIKDLATSMSSILPRLTYYGPTEIMTNIGDGCSKQAADATQRLYGGKIDQSLRDDAWYARKSVERAGGKTVWTPEMKKDYSKVQIGSSVSLDRFGSEYDYKKPKNRQNTLKDNEKVEHRGMVIGFDPKDGMPMIRHGSSEGKAVVQRMDNLSLEFPTHTLHYTPKSIYTPKDIMGKPIVDMRYYTKPEEADKFSFNPVNAGKVDNVEDKGLVNNIEQKLIKGINKNLPKKMQFLSDNSDDTNGNRLPTENEQKFIKAINTNLPKQMQSLGLARADADLLGKVAFGIFNNESKAGQSNAVGGKMILSSLAHAIGLKKSSSSLGDVQFKYDDLYKNSDGSVSKVGKNLLELGVDREGMSGANGHRADYNDEVNSVAAATAFTLSKIKGDPEKYQYDPKTQTIFGDIPIGVALAAAYSKGNGVIRSRKAMMKPDKNGNKPINYGNNAMKHSEKLNVTPAKGK